MHFINDAGSFEWANITVLPIRRTQERTFTEQALPKVTLRRHISKCELIEWLSCICLKSSRFKITRNKGQRL